MDTLVHHAQAADPPPQARSARAARSTWYSHSDGSCGVPPVMRTATTGPIRLTAAAKTVGGDSVLGPQCPALPGDQEGVVPGRPLETEGLPELPPGDIGQRRRSRAGSGASRTRSRSRPKSA